MVANIIQYPISSKIPGSASSFLEFIRDLEIETMRGLGTERYSRKETMRIRNKNKKP